MNQERQVGYTLYISVGMYFWSECTEGIWIGNAGRVGIMDMLQW